MHTNTNTKELAFPTGIYKVFVGVILTFEKKSYIK